MNNKDVNAPEQKDSHGFFDEVIAAGGGESVGEHEESANKDSHSDMPTGEMSSQAEAKSELEKVFEEPSDVEGSANTTHHAPDSTFLFDIEDAPEGFDMDSFLKGMAPFQNKRHKRGRKLPESHFIEIPKADIWDKVLNISDFILDSRLRSTGGKLNFFDLEVENEDTVTVRFCDRLYNVLVKIPLLNSENMVGENLQFFKPDLRAYVVSCDDEGFVIQKDSAIRDDVEIIKYKTYLFNQYVYVKEGMDVESEKGSSKRKFLFFDENEYQQHSLVTSDVFRSFLEPISKITEKRSKDEDSINTNRVHFYNDHAIILCADNSFLTLDYPKNMKFPECTVGTAFINLLYALMSRNMPNQALEICMLDNKRIKVAGSDFELSGPCYERLDLDSIKDFEDIALSFDSDKFTWIDKYLLERIMKYSCNMRLCTKKLQFNYGEEGYVVCIALHNDDNKDYKYLNYLNPQKQHDFTPLDKPVVISSQSLRRFFNAFSKMDYVGILIRNEQVIIKNSSQAMNIVLNALDI